MQLDKKQTLLLTITLLALGFLGYQIYTLVRSDLAQAQPSKSAPLHVLNDHTVSQNVGITAQNHIVMHNPNSQDASPNNNDIFASNNAHDQKAQQEYLELLNQYEIAKMKRQLLQEQATIAETEQHISQLNQQNNTTTTTPEILSSTDDDSDIEHAYQLSYVDRQNNVWSAALKIDNQFQEVAIGTLLPDNSQVINIDHEGVTIQKNTHRFIVTFNGLMNIKALPPQTPANIATQASVKLTPQKSIGLIPAKPLIGNNATPIQVKNTSTQQPIPKLMVVVAHGHDIKKKLVLTKNINFDEKKSKWFKFAAVAVDHAPLKIKITTPVAAQLTHAIEMHRVIKQPTLITVETLPVDSADFAPQVFAKDTTKNCTMPIASIKPALAEAITKKTLPRKITDASSPKLDAALKKATPTAKIVPDMERVATDLENSFLQSDSEKMLNPSTHSNSTGEIAARKIALVKIDLKKPDLTKPIHKDAKDAHAKISPSKSLLPVNPYLLTDQKILKVPSDHFTIQLIGANRITTIKQFTKQVQIDNDQDASVCFVNNQKQPSYMLIYGDYKSFDEAQLVLHYLPQSLKTHNPWIRSFADLQHTIQNQG